ncbi:MAG: MFS transporter, partial [Pseudomonadales bacterium]
MDGTSGKIFYGWKVVVALTVMLTFSSGLGFYNNAIMLQALSRDSGFAIEVASSAVSLFFLVSGLTGLVLAPIIEKHDVRFIIFAGALVSGLSLAAIGRSDSIASLFIAYACFGAGFAASSLLPATTLVARWFETSRAKALSLASTGLSLGGITLTPLAATLVAEYPLPDASLIIGILYFAGVAPLCLVLRSSPQDLGLSPYGTSANPDTVLGGTSFKDAIGHSYFWLLSIAYVFSMAAQVGSIAHQYGLMTERVSSAEASLGIAILPAVALVGR